MNTLARTTTVCFALVALAALPGCSPQEQNQAADSAERTLDKAGNAATRALDTTTDVVSDVSVTAAVKGKLAATEGISALDIDVTTKDNVVTLEGKVPSAAMKNLAGQIAKTTPGAKSVTNKLVIGK